MQAIMDAIMTFFLTFWTGSWLPEWFPRWIHGILAFVIITVLFFVFVMVLLAVTQHFANSVCPDCGKRAVYNTAPAGERRVYRCEACGKYQGVEV